VLHLSDIQFKFCVALLCSSSKNLCLLEEIYKNPNWVGAWTQSAGQLTLELCDDKLVNMDNLSIRACYIGDTKVVFLDLSNQFWLSMVAWQTCLLTVYSLVA